MLSPVNEVKRLRILCNVSYEAGAARFSEVNEVKRLRILCNCAQADQRSQSWQPVNEVKRLRILCNPSCKRLTISSYCKMIYERFLLAHWPISPSGYRPVGQSFVNRVFSRTCRSASGPEDLSITEAFVETVHQGSLKSNKKPVNRSW